MKYFISTGYLRKKVLKFSTKHEFECETYTKYDCVFVDAIIQNGIKIIQ